MELADHLDAIRTATSELADRATAAGLDAPVPTTPGWDVRRLIAHQGTVHRWATAVVEGERIDREAVEAEGCGSADPVGWLVEGGRRLIRALEDAPADLDVMVFLPDAPPPREFWARRQCHETTIHAVDALAAALGHRPGGEATRIDHRTALDGIDELLTGFVPQPRCRLRSPEPLSVAVLPDDSDLGWWIEVSPDPPVTRRRRDGDAADVVLRGSAVTLYLSLWNRSEATEVGVLGPWSELVRI